MTEHATGLSAPAASLGDELERLRLFEKLGADRRSLLADYLEPAERAAGEVIIHEDGSDRDMYFILDGEARILQGNVELARVAAGEHFGELELVAGGPRAASVVAVTDLRVARLTLERFDTLSREHSALALHIVRDVVWALRSRLRGMHERVSTVLQERTLPRQSHVTVRLNGEQRVVDTGTPAGDLLPARAGDRAVVAALLDRRAVPLTTPLTSDCTLAPLSTGHWEGRRIFNHSLGLLLMEAVHRIDPAIEVRMEHSVGLGQRVSVSGPGVDDAVALAREIEEQMDELVRTDHPLRDEWWTVDEARAHFEEQGWHGAADLLMTRRGPAVRLLTYGNVYAIETGPLVPRTGRLTGFTVLPEGEGLLLVYGQRAARTSAASMYPGMESAAAEARAASSHLRSMTQDHERWLRTLGITSIGQFNRTCVEGNVSGLIRVAEGFHEKRIGQIADQLRDRGKEIRVVCVAGPSSSGKTTFIKRLKVQLQVNGVRPVGLSLDDYYVDREETPLDEDGEYDYEAFEAIRVELFAEHLSRVMRGETVKTSHYDFKTGTNYPEGGPELTLRDNEILMLEGIHGLNPRLFSTIPAEKVYRVFICPLAQLPFDNLTRIHPSDVRLIRRIVRDRHGRGHNAADTIMRWPSVRRGERRHIFPYQHHADAVFDSSLIYELSVLRVFAERYLLEVPHDHDAFSTANRLLRFLDSFIAIYPDHVPPTSLLREFIGGSGFEY